MFPNFGVVLLMIEKYYW